MSTKEKTLKKAINFFIMKIQKILVPFLMMGILVSTTACSLFEKDVTDIDPEVILSPDNLVVISIDYYNEDQRSKFSDLVERFPADELWEVISKEIDPLDEDDEKNKDLVLDILEGKWKLVVGVGVDETDLVKSENYTIDTLPEEAMDVYFAGKFSKPGKVRELIDIIYEDEPVEYEEAGDYKYWSNENGKAYIVNYKDVFVLTNSVENRDLSIERIKNASGGFDLSEKLGEKISINDSLGYFYINMQGYGEYFSEFATGPFAFADYVYLELIAEESGIKVLVSSPFDFESEVFKELYPDPSYQAHLYEDLPGEDMILYIEERSSTSYVAEAIYGFLTGYYTTSRVIGTDFDTRVNTYSSVEDVIEDLADKIGVSVEDVNEFMDSPFAMELLDTGGLIPGVGIYFELQDAVDRNVANKLVLSLDETVEDLIVDVDEFLAADGLAPGMLKLEHISDEGSEFSKFYVDWNVFSDDLISQYNMMAGIDVSSVDLEVYYGITDDGKFVMALHPGFAEVYGKDFLSERELFADATEKLEYKDGFRLYYFETEPLFKIIDQYIGISKDAGLLSNEDYEDYDLLKRIIMTFKYGISSAGFEEGMLKADFYFEIEEVKGVEQEEK